MQGKKRAGILADMTQALGDNAHLYSTITKWLRYFKYGHMATEDAARPERLVENINPKCGFST